MRNAVPEAGSAGQGLAGYLALRGYEVALFHPPMCTRSDSPRLLNREPLM